MFDMHVILTVVLMEGQRLDKGSAVLFCRGPVCLIIGPWFPPSVSHVSLHEEGQSLGSVVLGRTCVFNRWCLISSFCKPRASLDVMKCVSSCNVSISVSDGFCVFLFVRPQRFLILLHLDHSYGAWFARGAEEDGGRARRQRRRTGREKNNW